MSRQIYHEFKQLGKLPSPSAVGLRILRITRDEDFSIDDLTAAITADPSLTARLLKLANSALRDGSEKAATVQQAALRLGSSAVRAVALGFSLVADNLSGPCPAFDYEQYWSTSLATAVSAQRLALLLGRCEPAEAFTCGLLAGIGRLALASVHSQSYAKLLTRDPDAIDEELCERELDAYQIDHVGLAAFLLEDWDMPSTYVDAVRGLRYDVKAGDPGAGRPLGVVLRLAQAFGRVLAHGASVSRGRARADLIEMERALSELGLDEPRLQTLWNGCGDLWADWGPQLGISVAPIPDVRSLLTSIERAQSPDAAAEEETSAPSPRPVESPVAHSGEPRSRVLVVDDDERIRRLLGYHLGTEGYEVQTTASGRAAVRLALEIRPQILITDWTMPELSGLELCRMLSQTDIGRRIHKIMLTARDNDDQVIEAFDAGADDYVFKPFNPRILLARVRAGERIVQMRERAERSERLHSRQVSELGILTRKLRTAAMTDPLTELPNRRFALTRLKQEWEAVARSGRSLSVTILDIDHFKRVNDEFGHDVGDLVLREVASVLRTVCRQSDVVCRLGGEEFLVVHIDTPLAGAVRGAERLRLAIEQHLIRDSSFQGGITVSLGVAERGSTMRGIDDLLKVADQALYVAKSTGRNKVVSRDSQGPGALSA